MKHVCENFIHLRLIINIRIPSFKIYDTQSSSSVWGLQRALRVVLGDRAGPGTGFLCPQRAVAIPTKMFPHSWEKDGEKSCQGWNRHSPAELRVPAKPACGWAFPAGTVSPLPTAQLGAVTDPSTRLWLEQGGHRGLRCRKMQMFTNSGLPKRERCPLEGATGTKATPRANRCDWGSHIRAVPTFQWGTCLLKQRRTDKRNFSFYQIICKIQAWLLQAQLFGSPSPPPVHWQTHTAHPTASLLPCQPQGPPATPPWG